MRLCVGAGFVILVFEMVLSGGSWWMLFVQYQVSAEADDDGSWLAEAGFESWLLVPLDFTFLLLRSPITL